MSDINPYDAPQADTTDDSSTLFTIYWTVASIPGLEDLSKQERARVWRKALSKVIDCWQFWAALFASILAVLLPNIVLDRIDAPTGVRFACVIPCGYIGMLLFTQVTFRRAIPLIRAERERQEQGDAATADPASREGTVMQQDDSIRAPHRSQSESE